MQSIGLRIQRYPLTFQKSLRDFGTVEMSQLFDQPFTHIHSGGITGVFPDMDQVMAIKQIVDSLNIPLGNSVI